MITCNNAKEVVALLAQREKKSYPTAPLHSEGASLSGMINECLYIGWDIKDAGNKTLVNEWLKFINSEKSELPNMVKDINKFANDMGEMFNDRDINMDELLNENNSDDGDEEDDEDDDVDSDPNESRESFVRSQVDGIDLFAMYLKIEQESGEEYVHILESTEYGEETSHEYTNIIIGLKLIHDNKYNPSPDKLIEDITHAKKKLIDKFPDRNPDDIKVFVDGDIDSGECYCG